MARNFKNKPKDMKLSVYLIHTRLLAQGTVIGERPIIRQNRKYQFNCRCPHPRHAASNVWSVLEKVQLVTFDLFILIHSEYIEIKCDHLLDCKSKSLLEIYCIKSFQIVVLL